MKKCLRCGKNKIAEKSINSGIKVNGISKLLELIKEKKNNLTIKNSTNGLKLNSENNSVIKTEKKKINFYINFERIVYFFRNINFKFFENILTIIFL